MTNSCKTNSCKKGKLGEREATYFLRDLGFADAKRTQQRRGDRGDAADVECVETLPSIHIEVKYGLIGISVASSLLADAVKQAKRDCPEGKWWCVLWRPKGSPLWSLTFDAPSYGVVTITDADQIATRLARENHDKVITDIRSGGQL